MLKIPKGLKKKKKGKKGKHKGDEDLFTPEELEEYKRQKALREQQEHQEAEAEEAGADEQAHAHAPEHSHAHATSSAASDNGAATAAAAEDEDRLQALLGGVDSILNKTQRDLERIKQTSFFQRKPTPSELESKRAQGAPGRPTAPTAAAVATASASKKGKKRWVGFEGDGDEDDSEDEHPHPPEASAAAAAAAFEPAPEQAAAHEEEEESEEEEDDGDDIFDTSYIDVITSGEVKLAYIPDSPTEQPDDGDDPFDTTYAAKVIGNDEDIKKRQKLEKVSLGIAVDVLTGKAAPPSKPPPLPENAVAKRAVPRRVKPVDLLKLGSFDEGSVPAPGEPTEGEAPAKADEPLSLLDDDELLAIPEDLPPVGTPIIPPASIVTAAPAPKEDHTQERDKQEDKQIDLSEFDVIAEKPAVQLPVSNLALVAAALGGPPVPALEEEDDELEDEFAALAQESLQKQKEEEDEFAVDGDDPFDTSAAAVILGEPDEPVRETKPAADVDVLLAGPPASWSAFDDDEHPHPQLKPSRPPPPRPAAPHIAAHIAHEEADIDPFDTSFAQNILPGKTELKLIEKEILSDHNEARILSNSDSDFDFNPREGEEQKQQQQSQVSFFVTDPAGDIDHSPVVHRDLLGGSSSDLSQLGHEPIAADAAKTEEDEETALHDDPFDTSAVDTVAAPGRTELRYLEKEILGDTPTIVAEDDDFDPRAEESKTRAARPDVLPGVPKTVAFALPSPATDLLAGGEEAGAKFSKPLTPYYSDQAPTITTDVDPFDTTHVTNLAPGKTELKILESELVDGSSGAQPALSDDEFDPRGAQFRPAPADPNQDLFKVEDGENVGHRPLTPAVEEQVDVDPFDTSIASNIAPGKAELKVLENELITGDPQPSIKRTYTDPDFNPRDEPGQSCQDLLNEPADPHHSAKPLTPVLGEQTSLENAEDIDPFDTSIATDIGPGKTELRILESELIGQQ